MIEHVSQLQVERECVRLNHRYALYADRGEASRIAELFTPDGCFETPGMTLRGREQIRETLRTRERLTTLRTVHQLTSIYVEMTGTTTATGWVTLCLYRRVAPDATSPANSTVPALVGHYEDGYSCVDGQWLIDHRRQHISFRDPTDPEWNVT